MKTVIIEDIALEVDYEYTAGEPDVKTGSNNGYSGCPASVTILSVNIPGSVQDISQIIDNYYLDRIEEEIIQQIEG